jgi:hypothetical protein
MCDAELERIESPKADAMADGLEVPLGILKKGISGGEFLPESCCRSNIGESEGNGGIGGGIVGDVRMWIADQSDRLGPHVLGSPAETHQGLTLLIYQNRAPGQCCINVQFVSENPCRKQKWTILVRK